MFLRGQNFSLGGLRVITFMHLIFIIDLISIVLRYSRMNRIVYRSDSMEKCNLKGLLQQKLTRNKRNITMTNTWTRNDKRPCTKQDSKEQEHEDTKL